jgi:hypothetical protein
MPGDPSECREHAKRCWALASEMKNPVVKQSLVELSKSTPAASRPACRSENGFLASISVSIALA